MKQLKLSEIEYKAWELPREITVSQWADENRILPESSAEPGPWRTSRTPYLKGVMNAFNDPLIEEITIMASTQVGKTETFLNMLGYVIDQDPGPTLLVMPREDDAKSFSHARIQPMIRSSLSDHTTGRYDDITTLEIRLDRMTVYLVGSNSPAALGARSIKNIFFDETDKYPLFSGREADPIKLASHRTRTFWNRKKIKASTPTTREGYIYREYEKSDKRRYYVPCPHCGHYQVFVFGQVKWPKEERDPEKIKHLKLAWYECVKCGGKITDATKQKMLLKGVWIPEGCSIDRAGRIKGRFPLTGHRGFWLNCMYSPWLTFSEIAAEWLKTQGYPELLMDFINSWLSEIWEEKTEETKPEKLTVLCRPYISGTVPAGVKVLTAGVDVQKDHFYVVIRGWGVGEESWLIRALRVESWKLVESAIFETLYPAETGGALFPVRLTCIDSGDRQDEVYNVCRKHKDVSRPVKGKDHLPGAPYVVSSIDKYPRTGKAIPGGLGLYTVDTSFFKDKINRLVHTMPGDPGEWHLHSDVSEEYLTQFCAEHKTIERDRKRGRVKEVWKKIALGAKNHFLDCEVYAAAAASMIYVQALRDEDEPLVYRPPAQARQRRPSSFVSRGQGGWISQKKGWVRRG